MLPHTRVTGVRTNGDTVTGVHTEHGDITCDVVVDAAGAWLRAVAALTGARVPVVPTRHQLMITQPIPGVQPNQPITRVIDTNVYIRPDEGGLMLGGYEPHPVQYDAAALPAGFDIANLELDFSVLRRLADSVKEQLPIFQRVPHEIGVRVHRGGLPTMTADGEHTVGPAPGRARPLHHRRLLCRRLVHVTRLRRGAGAMDRGRQTADGSVTIGPRPRSRTGRGDSARGLPPPIRPPLLGGGARGLEAQL